MLMTLRLNFSPTYRPLGWQSIRRENYFGAPQDNFDILYTGLKIIENTA